MELTKMSSEGKLFWFTGLSGSGKTTLSNLFYLNLKKTVPVVLLDGDKLREIFGETKDYSPEARLHLSQKYAKLCKMLCEQGVWVVCATISMFDSIRDWNRCNIPNYFEIYIRVSLPTLIKRNQKGLYSPSCKPSSVVGLDLPFEEPKKPDFIIDNEGNRSPTAILELLTTWWSHVSNKNKS